MNTFPKRFVVWCAVGLVSWLVVATGLWTLRGPTGAEALAVAVACVLIEIAGVWWISGRFPPRTTHWALLAGVHAFVALLFGSFLVTVTYATVAADANIALADAVRAARFVGAEFVFWIWLYAVLAVSAYGFRLREDLRTAREAATRSEARLAEARLATLRGQLNPHFLFNALHSVGALVPRDPHGAAEALERLGDLLRYSLDDATLSTVDVADEVRFTRTYMDLARLSLGNRLRATIEVDHDAAGLRVPPFSLQVLAENAIRHGIAPLPQGGTVAILARRAAGGVEFTVENDAAPTVGVAPRAGGLENLRARLDALYGPRATLAAAAQPGGGFHARIFVPAS